MSACEKNTDLSCYSQTGFLHRAADLTLVPSAAISKDFETAQVISGRPLSAYIMFGVHMFVFLLKLCC
jgi:hypothetical protein